MKGDGRPLPPDARSTAPAPTDAVEVEEDKTLPAPPPTAATEEDQTLQALLASEAAQATANAKVGTDNRVARFSGASSSQGVVRAVQPFDSHRVDSLVESKEWGNLETYLMQYMASSSEPLQSHPMVFLRIHMSRVVDMMERKNFLEAAQYFRDYIESIFQKIIDEAGQGSPRNASISSIADGLQYIKDSLTSGQRAPHPYTSLLMTKIVINDYMRLYLPKEIGYKLPLKRDALWAFAFPLESNSTSGPTFRCLVCSLEVFSSQTIRQIGFHLNQCPGMNCPYVSELLDHFKTKKHLSTEKQVQKFVQVEKADGKRQRIDSTTPSDNSITVDKDVIRDILREIKGADDLFTDIDDEVHGVVGMYNNMGTKVEKILGMCDKMKLKYKKIKGLASADHSDFATDPVSTKDGEGAYAAAAANNAVFEEAGIANVVVANNAVFEEVMSLQEMPRSANDPTHELMPTKEAKGFFVGAYF